MRTILTVLSCCAVLALTACSTGADVGASPGGDSASSTGADGSMPTIDITVVGNRITPNGERLKVGVGQPVTLRLVSDRAGELHVHSDPEQHLEFHKGRSTLKLTIERPGVIDVEEHDTGVVVVQLQVS